MTALHENHVLGKLIVSKLEHVKHSPSGKTTARCPACAAQGADKKGDHLFISADGKFGCVQNPGEAGREHRREIFALVGDGDKQPQERRPKRRKALALPKPIERAPLMDDEQRIAANEAAHRLAGDAALCARLAASRNWKPETIRGLALEGSLGWLLAARGYPERP